VNVNGPRRPPPPPPVASATLDSEEFGYDRISLFTAAGIPPDQQRNSDTPFTGFDFN